MGSMLLMLVILGFFMHSSQAIKCYSCVKSLSSDCDDPFTDGDVDTCTGNVCAKGKHTKDGRLTTVFITPTSILVKFSHHKQR